VKAAPLPKARSSRNLDLRALAIYRRAPALSDIVKRRSTRFRISGQESRIRSISDA